MIASTAIYPNPKPIYRSRSLEMELTQMEKNMRVWLRPEAKLFADMLKEALKDFGSHDATFIKISAAMPTSKISVPILFPVELFPMIDDTFGDTGMSVYEIQQDDALDDILLQEGAMEKHAIAKETIVAEKRKRSTAVKDASIFDGSGRPRRLRKYTKLGFEMRLVSLRKERVSLKVAARRKVRADVQVCKAAGKPVLPLFASSSGDSHNCYSMQDLESFVL